MPYLYVTADDCSRVAAQVQLLTTAAATKPDLTDRPAVENISDVWTSCWYLHLDQLGLETNSSCHAYRFNAQVMKIISKANAKPKPTIIP